MKQPVLFPKRLTVISHMRLGDLELHIRIRDLGDVRDEKHKGQDEDEDGDGEIHPLHLLQRLDRVGCVVEEGVRSQHGADDGADGVERLREIDPDFGVFGRSADCSAQPAVSMVYQ